MKMLPEVVFETPSNAEKRVFQLLKDSDAFQGATALHSLNCSEHGYKQWAEIDFCIVAPEGVFVLEVKGGGVSVVDGIWHFSGAKSEGTSKEGPFVQAKTARFALENMLHHRYRIESELSAKPVFGFGVVLVDTPWVASSPEMPREIVADRGDCRDTASFDRYLVRLASYWRNKKSSSAKLKASDIQKLRQTMRPDIDLFPPFTMRMGQALDQFQRMTEDQYQFMEWVEPNNQIIVTGGAGTGKTFLAMQCARMEKLRGRRVALVVESPTLAAYIGKMEPSKEISVLTLPQAKRMANREKFDVLLVDEGQDLLSLDSLSTASSILDGGLEAGRWRWFMDTNKQAHLRGAFDDETLDALRGGFGNVKPLEANLSTNVRNTKEIISRVEAWTEAALGTTKYTGHGTAPKLFVAEDVDQIGDEIERQLAEFASRQVPSEEIGIIVASRLGDAAIGELHSRFRRDTVRLGPATAAANLRGKAVIGNAADFKGLERPVVFAVGFDRASHNTNEINELYVATTRGNYGLVLVGTNQLIEALKSN